jgi:UDP-N-acetylglucosamine 4,6-dehydratase
MFAIQTILVTGGTGSFGKAFTKWLLANDNPKKLIIFSRDWLKQLEMRDELGNPDNVRWFIGDVRDVDRLKRALEGVNYVVHAAAIKDIDSCSYNPSECLLTNINGTQNVIDACIYNRVNKAILISTDKAVKATNTYGKSKAMAESLFTDGANYSANRTKFSVVRYGNVANSAGSVIPRFKKMIAEGIDSLPLTDERMTRYWFDMQDAIKLVYESFQKMQGGEIFIPEMRSFRIKDLIAAFNTPYHITGIRLGEKIHEDLNENENSGNNPRFMTVEELREMIK